MKRDVIIIGSGIGGLVTGYLLAQQGDHVVVLEHDKRPGGCLQAFYRDGIRFDTGFHFIGGMSEGGPLHKFFKDLNLLSLPWEPLKGQEIWLGDQCYVVPTGYDAWLAYLTEKFPHQEANLKKFLQVCKDVVECPFSETMPYWEKNAWEWLCETIDDSTLRDVVSGSSMIVELNKQTLPLFAYAEIVYSYVHSSHRLVAGGQPVVNHLLNFILSHGGEIHCSSTVTRILETDGKAVGVQLQNGTTFQADVVVSAIHPAETIHLLGEDTTMRKIYRRRIEKMTDSLGCFTANIKLKKGMVDLREIPIYVHRKGADIWSYNNSPIDHILIHCYPEQNALDFIAPISYDCFKQWDGTMVGKRGDEYEQYKLVILEQCLQLAETAMPGLRNAIDEYWTSSPLTWKNYFLAHNGTAYGVCKDCNAPEATLLLPRTPLHGLYLTGQSIILHGIMGTTISGFITAEFLKQ